MLANYAWAPKIRLGRGPRSQHCGPTPPWALGPVFPWGQGQGLSVGGRRAPATLGDILVGEPCLMDILSC